MGEPHDRDGLDARDDGWRARTAAAAFASHRLIGWIFWDAGAIERYAALGIPNGTGYYIASRAAPLAPAGNGAVIASFFSIHPEFIAASLDLARRHTTFERILEARDEAVGAGLRAYVPDLVDPLGELADELWAVVDDLDASGRVLFAAHRDAPRRDDPAVDTWLALNAIREWRGDSHWAIVIAAGLSGAQAGLLHDAWMGYPGEWIPRSRGADDDAIAVAFADLERRGLAAEGRVNDAGIALRQQIEDETDRISEIPWRAYGADRSDAFVQLMAEPGERLLARIDETAGPNWMPAARERRARTP
jgi:hypothetical protein